MLTPFIISHITFHWMMWGLQEEMKLGGGGGGGGGGGAGGGVFSLIYDPKSRFTSPSS